MQWKKWFSFMAICGLLCFAFSGEAIANITSEIQIADSVAKGSTIDLNVSIDGDEDVALVEVTITFDATLFEITDIQETSPIPDQSASKIEDANQNGSILVEYANTDFPPEGFTPSGQTMIAITFKANNVGVDVEFGGSYKFQNAEIQLTEYTGDYVVQKVDVLDNGGGNTKPVATTPATPFKVDTNTSLEGQLEGSDPDGDAITFKTSVDVDEGTLTINDNGSFTYDPPQDWSGQATFQFVVNDDTEDSDPATVTINVQNTPPEASAATFTALQDTDLEKDLSGYVSDPDTGDTLTYTVATQPTKGTVAFDGSTFTYTPNQGELGQDAFDYQVSDGDDSNTATVTINIVEDDTPVAEDHSLDVFRGTEANGDLSNYVENPKGTDLTYTINNDYDPAIGNVTGLDAAAGTYKYTPVNTSFVGSDTFTFTVDDGTDQSEPGTVTVNISCVKGDVDAMGDISQPVNIYDALMVAMYDAQMITEDDIKCFDSVDVNEDGNKNIDDALDIAEYDIFGEWRY